MNDNTKINWFKTISFVLYCNRFNLKKRFRNYKCNKCRRKQQQMFNFFFDAYIKFNETTSEHIHTTLTITFLKHQSGWLMNNVSEQCNRKRVQCHKRKTERKHELSCFIALYIRIRKFPLYNIQLIIYSTVQWYACDVKYNGIYSKWGSFYKLPKNWRLFFVRLYLFWLN